MNAPRNINCTVGSHRKKITDVLKLTHHYIILAVYLLQGLMID